MTTTSNNIDTELDRAISLAQGYIDDEEVQAQARAIALVAIQNILKADHNKLIKHLSFYYGLPEAEMKKVAEQIK